MKNGTTYRVVTDHLGSPRLVVDASTGTVVQRLDFDEYGVVLSDDNPNFQPFGFAGGLYDHETGLVRFGARDYDAETGRWTAKERLRFICGELNFYRFCKNDPINKKDPDGFVPQGLLSEDRKSNLKNVVNAVTDNAFTNAELDKVIPHVVDKTGALEVFAAKNIADKTVADDGSVTLSKGENKWLNEVLKRVKDDPDIPSDVKDLIARALERKDEAEKSGKCKIK